MRLTRNLIRKISQLEEDDDFSSMIQVPEEFFEWSRFFFPSYFALTPSSFHIWLADELETIADTPGSKLNVLAPRGAAKSTWITFAFIIWLVLVKKEPYIIIAAETIGQSEKYLDSIRDELEQNELLQLCYPEACNSFHARIDRIRFGNNSLVEITSTGSRIRGRKFKSQRPTMVIGDDLQGIADMYSETLRSRAIDWLFSDLLKCGTPETRFVVVGTAIHQEAIVCKLQEISGWTSKVFRSLSHLPVRMDLWQQWEVLLHQASEQAEASALEFFKANEVDMIGDVVSLWPERETVYQLMVMRATEGEKSFDTEKMNDPSSGIGSEWPKEYLDWTGLYLQEFPSDIIRKVIAVDPSKGSEQTKGDYSSICLLGKNTFGISNVNFDLERRTIEKLCVDLVRHIGAFKPEAVIIEANQMQSLIKYPLQEAAKNAGIELPKLVDLHNTENKNLRIRRLGAILCQRKARFIRSKGTALAVEQGKQFPNAKHDDGFDSWEMAERHLSAIKKKIGIH